MEEDMEENHKQSILCLTRLVGRYVNNLIDYKTFEEAIKELFSDKKDSKPTLKEFDLEAAKAGKPVCTRDGHKARILCFDLKNEEEYPIVAAIENDSHEILLCYTLNGEIVKGAYEANKDLMMLSEKKEGWINICRNLNTNKTELDTEDIYNTKEEALQNLSSMTYITTVKIEWEE